MASFCGKAVHVCCIGGRFPTFGIKMLQLSLASQQRWLETQAAVQTDSSQLCRPTLAQAKKMTDIGIRSIFTPEHDIIRENMRRFYQEQVVPHYLQWEKNGVYDRELFTKAGALGYLGSFIPEHMHGPGGDFLSTVIFLEESYYAHCPSVQGLSVHNHLVLPYFMNYASPEQIDTYIPRMVSGEFIGCIGMTEPSAGSDLQGIKTHAKQDGDDYIINGSKVFITNGFSSDVAIVVTKTKTEGKASQGMSLIILEATDKGFHKGKNLNKLGLKGADTAELFFEDVRVPKSRVLGQENHGFYYLMKQLALERIIVAGWSQAHSEQMFEVTREYVKERKVFGKKVADLQVIQHKLAELKTEICAARTFLDNLNLRYQETGQADPVSASLAKYKCTDLEVRVADTCVQMHGGMGYMKEMPIARSYLDARPQSIYAGTNEIMKELIGRSATKKD